LSVESTALLRVENHLGLGHRAEALRSDALTGLSATPKRLPPKWHYDERGSELFTEITRLPEYYLTRTERAILEDRAVELAELTEADTLVELGSGNSEKTRILLDALVDSGALAQFVAVDVSEDALRGSAAHLAGEYPGLEIVGVVGDIERHLDRLPPDGRRLVAFLGSSIGNFAPAPRADFLRALRRALEPGDSFLLGTDLVKDVGRLEAAYNDAAGVTPRFSKNVLHVLNRELGADFDVEQFEHVATWDAENEWIDIRLRSLVEQKVWLEAIGLLVRFQAGEELHTEISAKFRRQGVEQELRAAGFALERWWTDAAGDFALSLSRAA
jgi:L-histidine N-alpha-methyltransferase